MQWTRTRKLIVSQMFGIPIAINSYVILLNIVSVISYTVISRTVSIPPIYVPIVWALTSVYVYRFYSKTIRPKWTITFKFISKVIILVALGIVFGIAGYASYVNIKDIPNTVLNPPPSIAEQFISLDYPPAQGFMVTNDLLHININLTTSGSFVQGQFVNISVSGGISDRLLYNLSSISWYLAEKANWEQHGYSYSLPFPNDTEIFVGFGGASNVMDGMVSIPVGGPSIGFVELYVNYTNPDCVQTLGLGPTYVGSPTQTIVWASQGDYAPTISFSTGTYGYSNYTDIEQTYNNFIVHVSSSDVLAQARYNRITEVLTVVLVLFGFTEACKIILDSIFAKKSEVAVYYPIDNAKSQPQKPEEKPKPKQPKNRTWQRFRRKQRGEGEKK